ncbi:MAG: fumarylacetoacetate hydrolase family protein [Bacteroidetes bacterium]|nr:fumarylacetoacetate hydrolase family protein [Bacteroidota bacterium]
MGFVHDGLLLPAHIAQQLSGSRLPATIDALVANLDIYEAVCRKVYSNLTRGDYREHCLSFDESAALSPILRPVTLRDAYAFRQHVATSRRNRGLEMIPEFDRFPVFYFSNPYAVQGPGPVEVMPLHLDKLDYELEVAAVLGRGGKNLKASEADAHIFGLMCMNDWSARGLQMEEMKLNLGPAKGKDFATSLGPVLVTLDELEERRVAAPPGHTGSAWNLRMTAAVNGRLESEGNLSSMDWTFAEVLERISYGVQVFPGEVIGSGTVGTGCLLELNGTRSWETPDYTPYWLQTDDQVIVSIEKLGVLRSTIVS